MFTQRYLHHYRKLTLAALAVVAVAFPPAVRAQYGLALSPMRTELNLASGTQRNGSLSIANDDATPGRFRTEILDLSIDKEAVPQFEKDIPSEKEFSCKDWLTVNPMEGEIPGKGQLMVRYSVNAFRTTLLSTLNPASILVLQGQTTGGVSDILDDFNQWSFYVRLSHRAQWGTPPPTAPKVKPRATARADLHVMKAGTFIKGTLHGLAPEDEGTVRLENIVINLISGDGDQIRYTTCDSTGDFAFYNLPTGKYQVAIDQTTLPENYILTSPPSIDSDTPQPAFVIRKQVKQLPIRRVL